MKNRLVSAEDVINLHSCYTPKQVRKLFAGKRRRLSTLCKFKIPSGDVLWAVPRLLSRQNRCAFAAACVRRIWHLLPDEGSKAAIVACEKFARGEIKEDQLDAAAADAADAYYHYDYTDAASTAAAYAAYAATAAYGVYAAGYAADAAAIATADVEGVDDTYAATYSAALAAEREAQVRLLHDMLKG